MATAPTISSISSIGCLSFKFFIKNNGSGVKHCIWLAFLFIAVETTFSMTQNFKNERFCALLEYIEVLLAG
ncbi:unnamed protein product, partial [Nesidiocoris tenuis]